MKKLALFLCLATPLCAQWIVNDPVNTAVNTAIHADQAANHLEILRQWTADLVQAVPVHAGGKRRGARELRRSHGGRV